MKAIVTITLDPDIRDQLDTAAAREERSRSAVANRAIRAGLAAGSQPACPGAARAPEPRDEKWTT
jgi:predicted transcriptional regulator